MFNVCELVLSISCCVIAVS